MQEIRKPAVALTGTASWASTPRRSQLKAGQWMFYSTSGKKNYFVVVR